MQAAAPFADERLIGSPLALPLLRLWLGGGGFEIDTFSYIQAEPGTAAQRWHTDVPQRTHRSQPSDAHSAHGVVQILPLVDVTEAAGATAFLCGSHRDTASRHSAAAAGEAEETEAEDAPWPSGRAIAPSLERGSAAFFDLRLRHRGGALPADTPRPRPVLYVSFVKEWFRDTLNFRGTQSRAWDELPSHRLRKLLTRIDARGYVAGLERALRDRGVDPSDLASAALVPPPSELQV